MQNKSFRTYDLAKTFYKACQNLDVRGAMRNQLDRAALSVPLNLAEGRGRQTLTDQKRFFQIAYGSLKETQAILDISDASPKVIAMADVLGAHLYRLIQNAR